MRREPREAQGFGIIERVMLPQASESRLDCCGVELRHDRRPVKFCWPQRQQRLQKSKIVIRRIRDDLRRSALGDPVRQVLAQIPALSDSASAIEQRQDVCSDPFGDFGHVTRWRQLGVERLSILSDQADADQPWPTLAQSGEFGIQKYQHLQLARVQVRHQRINAVVALEVACAC